MKFLAVVPLTLFLVACPKPEDKIPLDNNPPTIDNLFTDSEIIKPGDTTVVNCEASDLDDDKLDFDWNTPDGVVYGESSIVGYIAGSRVGNHIITCIVTDELGGSDTSSVSVNVEPLHGTITDIDGNVYQTLRIGSQTWMTENLCVTKYRDGTAILELTTDGEWLGTRITLTGAFCYMDNIELNADTLGALYNWFAVTDNRGLAPEGWHVPTDDDWKELEMHLGMSQSQANRFGQFRGTDEGSQLGGDADLWADGSLENHASFNTSGFMALPGGVRYSYFKDRGYRATFWSASDYDEYGAWYRFIHRSDSRISRGPTDKIWGFSIRCIRD